MADVKCSAEAVIGAIQGSAGIKAAIARKLGLHRNSINHYLARYPTVRAAYEDEVETVGDLAESVIVDSIRAGEVETAKWYARMKLKDRGYVERTEQQTSGDLLVRVEYVDADPAITEAP